MRRMRAPAPLAAVALVALLALSGCAGPGDGGQEGDGSGDGASTTPPSSATTSGATRLGTQPPTGTDAPARTCKGTHAHATFAVFVQEAAGPRRVDYAAPRSDAGEAWYDLGVSPTMTVAVHLHQRGAEQGSDALGPAQFHFEASGRCPTVAQAMASVETQVASDGITLTGAHARAQQNGTWPGPVAVWLQSAKAGEGGCAWTWSQVELLQSWLGHAPGDGEALLAAAGTFTEAQVQAMQAEVPAPMTRGEPSCP